MHWFIELVKNTYNGTIDTDYATLNYVTLNELNVLEKVGMLVRTIDADAGTDIVTVE